MKSWQCTGDSNLICHREDVSTHVFPFFGRGNLLDKDRRETNFSHPSRVPEINPKTGSWFF